MLSLNCNSSIQQKHVCDSCDFFHLLIEKMMLIIWQSYAKQKEVT